MKLLFIINPIAGYGRKSQIINLIGKKLDREKYDYEMMITNRKGHASILAKQAVENGIDAVIAIGGDGTVNEVARTLVHTRTALGIIPCGSGNGLARHMKISMTPSTAIHTLNMGVIETIDYGTVNGELFFCTCGVGLDASVSMEFAKSGRRGLLGYVEKSLEKWITYKPDVYELKTENSTTKQKALFITCGNASQWGNDAYIAPCASLQDGLIDVTIVEPFLAIEAGPLAIQLLNKTIDRNRRVKSFKCDRLTILRSKEGAVHYDGEASIMDKKVEINIVPRGLKVIIPEKSVLKL